MTRRMLPIGIQTFREIRERDCYYVDKTGFALRLIEQGKYYFLSRPRRFGKSLFLDTLGALFSGEEALFRGLVAHGRWDWKRRSPVMRLSFAERLLQSRAELDEKIRELFADNEVRVGVRGPHQSISGRFHGLIRAAHEKAGEGVVVLVDEYDKPILDNLRDITVSPEGRALQQIKDRGYAGRYRPADGPIHRIGVEFSRERRSVVGFEVETLTT